MTVLSIPVSDEIKKKMELIVLSGDASNLSDVARKALTKYLNDIAVENVLKAQKEPSLIGDLDDLAKKI